MYRAADAGKSRETATISRTLTRAESTIRPAVVPNPERENRTLWNAIVFTSEGKRKRLLSCAIGSDPSCRGSEQNPDRGFQIGNIVGLKQDQVIIANTEPRARWVLTASLIWEIGPESYLVSSGALVCAGSCHEGRADIVMPRNIL
jgi:hypothetical protein